MLYNNIHNTPKYIITYHLNELRYNIADRFTVKVSNIRSAGLGLFTNQNINNNTILGEYFGTKHTLNKLFSSYIEKYIYRTSNDILINPDNYCLFRYINDGLTYYQNNTKFVEYDNYVLIVATKDISYNTELFINYGKEYWSI